MKFTNTVTIKRRSDGVFAFLAHFENVRLWNYAIAETRKITEGPVGVGSRYRQTRTLPTRSEKTFAITEFEPVRLLSIGGGLGPFEGEIRYLLEPVGNATVPHEHHDPPALGPAAARRAVGGSSSKGRGRREPRHAQADSRNGRRPA